jgi:hypothetical protein
MSDEEEGYVTTGPMEVRWCEPTGGFDALTGAFRTEPSPKLQEQLDRIEAKLNLLLRRP